MPAFSLYDATAVLARFTVLSVRTSINRIRPVFLRQRAAPLSLDRRFCRERDYLPAGVRLRDSVIVLRGHSNAKIGNQLKYESINKSNTFQSTDGIVDHKKAWSPTCLQPLIDSDDMNHVFSYTECPGLGPNAEWKLAEPPHCAHAFYLHFMF